MNVCFGKMYCNFVSPEWQIAFPCRQLGSWVWGLVSSHDSHSALGWVLVCTVLLSLEHVIYTVYGICSLHVKGLTCIWFTAGSQQDINRDNFDVILTTYVYSHYNFILYSSTYLFPWFQLPTYCWHLQVQCVRLRTGRVLRKLSIDCLVYWTRDTCSRTWTRCDTHTSWKYRYNNYTHMQTFTVPQTLCCPQYYRSRWL